GAIRGLRLGARHLGVLLGLHVGRLGFLLAHVLGVAREVVTLLLGHLVLGIGPGLVHLVSVLLTGLVVGLELGLGDLLVALGLLLADVLGIALHAVALGLGGLVVGFDAILGGLVLVLAHRHPGGGHQAGDGQR